MIKIYYGSDPGYTTHKLFNDLKKNLSSEDFSSLIKYDGYKDLVSTVIDDCLSYSLFSSSKNIIFTNCYFLTSSNKKVAFSDASQNNFKDLIRYLSNPSPDTNLYLVADSLLKKSGDLYEAINDSADVVLISCEVPSDDEYIMLANKTAKEQNKTITSDAIKALLERCRIIASTTSFGAKSIDYLMFNNNLTKLFTYKDNITVDDINELIYQPLEDNVFSIIQELMNKNTKAALKIYQDLLKQGLEGLSILPAFVSKFKDYALIKYLISSNYDNNEIALQLSKIQNKTVKPGSIYYKKKEIEAISYNSLLKVLNDLAEIEVNIKFNQDDANILLSLFIANFKAKYLYN